MDALAPWAGGRLYLNFVEEADRHVRRLRGRRVRAAPGDPRPGRPHGAVPREPRDLNHCPRRGAARLRPADRPSRSARRAPAAPPDAQAPTASRHTHRHRARAHHPGAEQAAVVASRATWGPGERVSSCAGSFASSSRVSSARPRCADGRVACSSPTWRCTATGPCAATSSSRRCGPGTARRRARPRSRPCCRGCAPRVAPGTIEGREQLAIVLPEPVWVDVEAAQAELDRARAARARRRPRRRARGARARPPSSPRRGLLPGYEAPWLEARGPRSRTCASRRSRWPPTRRCGSAAQELPARRPTPRAAVAAAPYRESARVVLISVLRGARQRRRGAARVRGGPRAAARGARRGAGPRAARAARAAAAAAAAAPARARARPPAPPAPRRPRRRQLRRSSSASASSPSSTRCSRGRAPARAASSTSRARPASARRGC